MKSIINSSLRLGLHIFVDLESLSATDVKADLVAIYVEGGERLKLDTV